MNNSTVPSGQDPDQMQTPDGYVLWSAATKNTWLWNLIEATAHRPIDLPPLQMPFTAQPLREIGVVTKREELVKTLTREDDLMEPGRPKVIHARGAVALVDLETSPASPFTGLLGPPPNGGGFGLIRMSLVAKVVGKAAVTPAFGLKLLIDGRPSADLLAMNHTVGQGRDFDLFSNTMSNDLTDSHKELRPPQKMMSVMFDRVSNNPRRLVVDHFAERLRDGSAVIQLNTPIRLVFHPTPEAKGIFAGQAGVDFRLVLAEVAEGTPLYDVTGTTASGSEAVGVLRTSSRFVSSEGGDRLFFRHVQDPKDVKD